MRAAVFLEHRFERTPDGAVWTDGAFAYGFFTRYLDVFDEVRAVARVRPADRIEPAWVRADGSGVGFEPVPYYVGPWQYLRGLPRTWLAAARAAQEPDQATILRAPSEVCNLAARELIGSRTPFAAEVVGDPWDAYAPGSISHPLRALARRRHVSALRRICRHAAATAYVTARALQRRYPPSRSAFTTHYSSVELPEAAFAPAPRVYERPALRLVTVGSMEHFYKAQDVLLDALAGCGRNIRLALVGDGRCRLELEQRALRLGLASRVDFRGARPAGEAVRSELDRADLFVLPSRQEGLPRAMIEAMARGLPCIGSDVGGIDELLRGDCIVPAGDSEALRSKILELAGDPARMACEAERNLVKARGYRESVLNARRRAFYAEVRRSVQNARQLKPLPFRADPTHG